MPETNEDRARRWKQAAKNWRHEAARVDATWTRIVAGHRAVTSEVADLRAEVEQLRAVAAAARAITTSPLVITLSHGGYGISRQEYERLASAVEALPLPQSKPKPARKGRVAGAGELAGKWADRGIDNQVNLIYNDVSEASNNERAKTMQRLINAYTAYNAAKSAHDDAHPFDLFAPLSVPMPPVMSDEAQAGEMIVERGLTRALATAVNSNMSEVAALIAAAVAVEAK